ncbi:MAG: DUF115 domain-containing protein [Treponema sp.]|nr:DUF115 domain-containing protein [Treponema sp.]
MKGYIFQESKSGKMVPAILSAGNIKPLHSMIDPVKEAERLVSSIGDMTFVVFLGLGGGFAPEAALKLKNINIVVIDFNKENIRELLAGKDYSKLLTDDRFKLFIDPSCEDIKKYIIENFKPALCGGIKTIPLRTRIEQDIHKFETISSVIQEAVEIVSGDYSVQAHFGKRWFSNIIRNIRTAQTCNENLITEKKITEAAIVAAGPSLDNQLCALADLKSKNVFIISTDTALNALIYNGIEPDAVVSIDCQHISYYHFMDYNRKHIPLVMDIASPPLISSFSSFPVFFSSGHPLALYLSLAWPNLPFLDTSGGNVTYACLSLAEALGAKRITLFGADFSYVNCKSYARGTYIYPFFSKKQNRLSPLEAQLSSFLYRSPFLPSPDGKKKNYCETYQLRFYRKKLEKKAAMMSAKIICASGQGAPINLQRGAIGAEYIKNTGNSGKSSISGQLFLEQYRNDIAALPDAKSEENYILNLNCKERQVFTTLLPYAASIKRRKPELLTEDIIKEVKEKSISIIEKTLSVSPG